MIYKDFSYLCPAPRRFKPTLLERKIPYWFADAPRRKSQG